MKYLIRQWIEALHANAQCPRLMVDATADGVDVPQHVRDRWAEAMPIDLDPAYPLELAMTDDGVDCVLSFGVPYACHIPWSAIYVVQDRDSQVGVVIEENLPPRFVLETEEHVPPGPAVRRPAPVSDEPDAGEENDDKAEDEAAAPAPPPPRPALAALRALDDEDAEHGADDDADEASVRRARFKVIDGGKS